MMGDPFEKMTIDNGILIIDHFGGGWKWKIIDKYRFQENEFILIGYTNIDGRPCEY